MAIVNRRPQHGDLGLATRNHASNIAPRESLGIGKYPQSRSGRPHFRAPAEQAADKVPRLPLSGKAASACRSRRHRVGALITTIALSKRDAAKQRQPREPPSPDHACGASSSPARNSPSPWRPSASWASGLAMHGGIASFGEVRAKPLADDDVRGCALRVPIARDTHRAPRSGPAPWTSVPFGRDPTKRRRRRRARTRLPSSAEPPPSRLRRGMDRATHLHSAQWLIRLTQAGRAARTPPRGTAMRP